MSKRRQKASKARLKTMDQISAAEAGKLFHAAWGLDATGQYYLRPEHFPENIAAAGFFKVLMPYCGLLREQRAEGADIPQPLTEKDLDTLFFRAPQQRKIVEVIRQNKDREMSLDDIAVALGRGNRSTKTVQNLLTKIYEKTKSKNLTELARNLLPLT
jgi:DNA-binding CsgD family transcriptional regulator